MTEKRPTLYREVDGRWKPIAQYATQDLAEQALARFRERQPDQGHKLELTEHRPESGKYDKRGRWRKSGIRQVSKWYT
jgi:hypothetical protein